MSFLGGAECSTAANPLAQFTKHVQDDKSLQRDRLVGRSSGGIQEGFRSRSLGQPQNEQAINNFMHQPLQMDNHTSAISPFAMEQMQRELERTTQQTGSPAWATEFVPGLPEQARMEVGIPEQRTGGFSPAEFVSYQASKMNGVERATSPLANSATSIINSNARPMGLGYRPGVGGMGVGMGMGMGMGMTQMPMTRLGLHQRVRDESKGKDRVVELNEKDWEAQFAQMESDQTSSDQNQEQLDKLAKDAMEAELAEMDRSVLSETNEFGDFEGIWRGIQAETANARMLADGQYDYLDENGAWEGPESWTFPHGLNTHQSLRDPQLGDYLFEEDNLFNNVTDPFGEGMRIVEEGGNLSLAALAFEAAVQREPEHVEAWTKLGSVQAQNEKESPAIRALEQALKLDPSNLEALMGLAVSYTNEGYDTTAYRTLERWIATKYPTVMTDPLSSPADVGFTDRQRLHEKVTELFIAAAQLSPSGESMDPDVQVGLGVLFYGAEEYDKAVDCFEAALASTEPGTTNERSQLHLLWNRLGATMANSGRSEEAIDAYERALSLRPNFVRARYNLGVSCINIGCYEEAAQHLLGALAMHKVVEREGRERAKEVVGDGVDDVQLDRLIRQNQSTNLFDTLRRVFNHMNRKDLSDMVGPEMDVDAFRKEFEF